VGDTRASGDVGAARSTPDAPHAGRFHAGQLVTVRELPVTGHVRTPWYVRGRTGRVVAERGRWPNPELLAYGRDDHDGADVFAVEFDQHELWSTYEGSADDRLLLDLCAHWLEGAPGDDAHGGDR